MTEQERQDKIKENRNKALDDLAKGEYGKALFLFIDEKIKKLDTARGYTDQIELLGRQKAIDILEEIFSFLDKRKDKNTPNQGNQYL